ncbi:hypothetical protein D3H55_22265 [Bacillus salacetis]|uniref:Uncharacterized protein n=1 Tax=Bacillus salacetis TaxID=2315464 RepID=A0A3A1QMH8_9BACI|nr:hypothetical protein [Bacillus salacetis]RIW28052.1 hypothetical protein D3H55_22265 [Bacillus salacetis]
MAKEKIPSDLYESLRNAGFQLENHLNEYIHKYLNKKEFAAAASIFKTGQSKLTSLLQELHEAASPHLNVPTKQDLANISKLIIQVEEKVDVLSDQVEELTETVKRLNKEQPLQSSQTDASVSDTLDLESKQWEDSIQERIERLEALKEMAANSLKPEATSAKIRNMDIFQLLDMLQRKKKDE